MKKSSTLVLIFIFLTIHLLQAQEYYVFVGSYNWDKTKEGLYVYKLDTLSGRMTKVSAINNVLNPGYLTISPDGKYIYACTEAHITNAGSVSSFAFDAEKGTLLFVSKQKSEGGNPVYLTVHQSGRWLVNANYTGGSVSAYRVNADGKIEVASQVIAFSDSSINKERQDHAHIHSAVFSPMQDYIFFPDLGADKIRCYAFDQSKSQPLQPAAYPFTTSVPGSGPRHFTFHPNGRFCYCTEEMGGAVTTYKYENGKLDSFQRIGTHNRNLQQGYSNADIHISPDGLFLYASERAENIIAIFSIDQRNGTLKSIGYQSVSGDHPRNFVIDPTGKFLLVANQVSGDVIVFKRNRITGKLIKTNNKIRIPGVSCLQIRKY